MGRLTVYGGSSGSTLTVSTTETLTINGKDYGGYVTKTIPNIINVVRRIDTILHTSEVAIANFGDAVSAGTYNDDKVKYMRFTNIDDTNFITLTFAMDGTHEFAVKVDAGCSLSLFGDVGDTGTSGGFKTMFDADVNALDTDGGTLADLVSIHAIADTGSVDLEVYMAMI